MGREGCLSVGEAVVASGVRAGHRVA